MPSQSVSLQDVKTLSPAQKAVLKKSNFKEVNDVILTPPGEIAKKLKTSLSEAQSIIEILCKELAQTSLRVHKIGEYVDEKFTTGDSVLDRVVGGGIRTGMVWELAGESASGKTQLALQLCLLVQVRPVLGGISGSACYLSTHTQLSTKRLNQLISSHPLLSPSVCSLSDIHTVAVPTVELLMRTLTITFPALQAELQRNPPRKPVKLIVIDSISALFHNSGKASSSTLFERSRALSELSHIMHEIAAREKIAFVIINEVTDVFNDHYHNSQDGVLKSDILYRDQARWFSSAHSIRAESAKEACLGLAWANQLNARIMLTRTNRRKHIDDPYPLGKRRQIDVGSVARGQSPTSAGVEDDLEQAVLLRRLTVVFSSVSTPASVDFIVTNAGVSAASDEIADASVVSEAPRESRIESRSAENNGANANQPSKAAGNGDDTGVQDNPGSQQFINARSVSTTKDALPSKGIADESLEVIPSTYPEVDEFDDDAIYWEGFDQIPDDALVDIDFDGLERSQIEEDLQPSAPPVSAADNG